MENKVTKYANGKIYKLISDATDKIYIGSTCQKLHKRFHCHKNSWIAFKEGKCKSKTMSFDLFDLGNVEIILIDSYPCNSKEELHAKERHYIDINKNNCINKNIPNRTIKEWIVENCEHVKQMKKELYEKTKEKCIERQKIRYQENKEEMLSYHKKYQMEHKLEISAKRSKKIVCSCGGRYSLSNKAKHNKSLIHVNFIPNV